MDVPGRSDIRWHRMKRRFLHFKVKEKPLYVSGFCVYRGLFYSMTVLKGKNGRKTKKSSIPYRSDDF